MTALTSLISVLDVEQVEQDLFRGRSADNQVERVFGGHVSAQALVAAARTVQPDHEVHSLQVYFIRPGIPGTPVVYRVDRLRDGSRFSTRRVAAVQEGRVILSFTASFTSVGGDVLAQGVMPDVPPPEDLPNSSGAPCGSTPFDIRYVGEQLGVALTTPADPKARNQLWVRADGEIPDDHVLGACLLTYASDLTLLDQVLLGYRLAQPSSSPNVVSLDHSIWFHAPVGMDDWLLFDQGAPTVTGARGLGASRVFDRAGVLVATVLQEGLIT